MKVQKGPNVLSRVLLGHHKVVEEGKDNSIIISMVMNDINSETYLHNNIKSKLKWRRRRRSRATSPNSSSQPFLSGAHRSGGWAHYRKGGVGLIRELSPKLIEIGSANAGWMMGSSYRWRQQTSNYK